MAVRNPIDLTSFEVVKNWFDSKESGVDDERIQLVVTALSRQFLNLTGRGNGTRTDTVSPFNQPCTYTERLKPSQTGQYFVRNAPVQSILAVKRNGMTVQPGQTASGAPYRVAADGQSVYIQQPCGPRIDRGHIYGSFQLPDDLEITYTAGWPLIPVTNEAATITAGVPYQAAQSYSWLDDQGVVYDDTSAPLTAVSGTPGVGQYSVTMGIYTFADAEDGRAVRLNYGAKGTPEDIVLAVTKWAALEYRRRRWIGLSSDIQRDLGQNNYTQSEVPPGVQSVIDLYRRRTY